MAHFAKLGVGNIVETVEVVSNNVLLDENGKEQEQLGVNFLRELYNEPHAQWFQTSYNYNFRKNYAGIGFTYDTERNAFIAPKVFDSWKLNETTCRWEAPITYPSDGNIYIWDESAYQADNTKGWIKVTME